MTSDGSKQTHIRWMIRRDMPEITRIEQASFGVDAWPEEEFLRHLRCRYNIGLVAEREHQIAGYVIYRADNDDQPGGGKQLTIINLAVDPTQRRTGVGTALVKKLQGKLTYRKRKRITADVHEAFLEFQLFLRANGFRAIRVMRGMSESDGADMYHMQYRVRRDANAEYETT